MSSDTTPIVPPNAPPSYVESQRQYVTTQQPNSSYPPPYTPPTYQIESSGASFRRFDVIEGPVTLVSLTCLTALPCLIECPHCKRQVLTVTQSTPGALTCLMACLCAFIFLPCVVVPFCVDGLQDVTHSCPVCLAYVGTFSRI